ncbi:MAG: DNA primase [Synergistaceae bacterium]|nr:DNA primase [Synergistaceae bacterium]
MEDAASEVKSRVDIIDIVGGYVKLRRVGNSFTGLCPFHKEKNPSFRVQPDWQTYHCFGCGKSGDAFTFIMEMEGLGFREALAYLADKVGVQLSAYGFSKGKPVRDVRSALEEAKKFFRASLEDPGGEAARAYLARRNILPDDASRFGLGWAPQSWDALTKRLVSLGFAEAAFEAGLVVKGDKGEYDRFRGRITFPVSDDNGGVVAFGGRLIDGEGAKYINSPEGPLFNKRRTLYLMDIAKRTIRERGRAVLVEGYMDAIRAHLAGFTETIASLGTSLTEEQAVMIKRFTDLCYISYDADGAGQSASIRGMYILQRHGVEVRVVTLPQGLDPDDFLSRKDGSAEFEDAVGHALPLPLYHVHIKRKDLRTPGRAMSAREEIFSGLASLPLLDIAEHISNISRSFGILEHELRSEIDARRREMKRASAMRAKRKSVNYEEGIDDRSNVYINEGQSEREKRELDLECAFCSLLWHNDGLRSRWDWAGVTQFFSDEATRGIASALMSGDSPVDLESRWRAIGETVCFERVARGDAVIAATGLKPEQAEKVLGDIRERAMRRKYEFLKPLVISGEAEPNQAAEFRELAGKLKGRR